VASDSCDVKKAHKLAASIKAGTIWVNCYNMFDPQVPFGGYKMSGYGRELGKHSIDLLHKHQECMDEPG